MSASVEELVSLLLGDDGLADLLERSPIPFVLTDAGNWATQDWIDTTEAGRLLELPPDTVAAIASRGGIVARKVGRRWLLSKASVEAYLRERRGRGRGRRRPGMRITRTVKRLPAEPLVSRVNARGGLLACGVAPGSADEAAFYRARREGTLTVWAADRLAVNLLRLTLWEVWDVDAP